MYFINFFAAHFLIKKLLIMLRSAWLIVLYLLHFHIAPAQVTPLNRQVFFLDDRVIETTLTTDIRKLRNDKKKPAYQPATITMTFSDTMEISCDIGVMPRGSYRKENCDLASLMLNFKSTPGSGLAPLKELKLVGGCHLGLNAENVLLKEYLVYKIYNFISAMSFRVRLMHVTYKDSKQKAKSHSQYAFLIEDMKDLAKRNNCVEIKKTFKTEETDRRHINLVSLFQYMIGNTDWAVPVRHNIKLMALKTDTFASPFVIPYDFDYSGLVNAPYAVPAEAIGTTSVTERVYRGYARNMGELQLNLDILKEKKEQIMFYLKNFTLLDANDKREMTNYLKTFYEIIDNKNYCKSIFIDNAVN